MATVTLTPAQIYVAYSWDSSTFYDSSSFTFKSKSSGNRYLIQMPATSVITADKVQKITITFTDNSSENVESGTNTLYIGFSSSKSFPSSYQSGTITYTKNIGATQTFTIAATPTVSINGVWYMEIYWSDSYNDVYTSASSMSITLTYSNDNTVKYHTGSSWVECIPYYHNGSTWVQCVPYYHNGSGWVECNGG